MHLHMCKAYRCDICTPFAHGKMYASRISQAFVTGDAGEVSGDTFEQLTHVYVQYVLTNPSVPLSTLSVPLSAPQ